MEQETNFQEESTIKTIEFRKAALIVFVAVVTTAVIVGGGVSWWVVSSLKPVEKDIEDISTVTDTDFKQKEGFNGSQASGEYKILSSCFEHDSERPGIDSILDTSRWQQFSHGFIGEIAYPDSIKIEFNSSRDSKEHNLPDEYAITSVYDIDTSARLWVYDLQTMAYTYSPLYFRERLFYTVASDQWYWHTGEGFVDCVLNIATKTETGEPIYSYGENSHGYQTDTYIVIDRATDGLSGTHPRLYVFELSYGHPDAPRTENERTLSRQFAKEVKTMIGSLRFYRTKG